MRLLLDTATYIWFVKDDSRLTLNARSLLLDASNELFLSTASAWEIVIKHAKGQLELGVPVEEFLTEQRRLHWIESLPINEDAVLKVRELPLIHQDPFDRIIIAQALVEDMAIVTPDGVIAQYAVPVAGG